MKKLQLIIAALAISLNTSAQSNLSAEQLLELKPGKTTQSEAEQLLGKAAEKLSQKEHSGWRYSENGNNIQLHWSNDQLTDCSVSTNKNRQDNWNKANNQLLNIGTDIATILKALGLPNNMKINADTHLMEYQYQSNVLHLSFKDGQLLRYEMNGTVARK